MGFVSRSLRALFVLAFAAAFVLPLRASSGGPNIGALMDAYGGRGVLSGVRTLSLQGKITTFFSPDSGTYVVELKRPGKLLVDISYTEKRERRILNNGRGYSGSGAGSEEVQGMAVAAMVYQYNQMDLPFGLAEGTLALHVLRRGTLHGRAVDVAEIRDRAGKKHMEVDIDLASHRIVRTAANFGMGGEQAVLSAEFGDFRKVSGILLPYLITNYAGDMKISETRVESYSVNGAISDAVFLP